MGKTRRGKHLKSQVENDTHSEMNDEILKKLRAMSKDSNIIIGFNAVLRYLQQNKLGLVAVSEGISSTLFKAINLLCSRFKVSLFSFSAKQLQTLESKASQISIVGVKRMIIDGHELEHRLKRGLKERYSSLDMNVIGNKEGNISCAAEEENLVLIVRSVNSSVAISEPFCIEKFPYAKKQLIKDSNKQSNIFIPFSEVSCHNGFPSYNSSLDEVLINIKNSVDVIDLSQIVEV